MSATMTMTADDVRSREIADEIIAEREKLGQGKAGIWAAVLERQHSPEFLKKPPSRRELIKYLDAVSDALTEHIKTLQARIVELESRGELKYVGVFKQGQVYSKGNFATHGGSLFHCNEATMSVPGSSDAWSLCAKRGSDGNNGPRR